MSAILKAWQAGRGFPDTLVIDGHVHFDGGFVGRSWDSVGAAADNALEIMDGNGVDAVCVLGGGFYGPGNDYTVGNDDLLEFCRRAPERFIGFAHLTPLDSEQGLADELRRVFDLGFRCLKLINDYQLGYPGDGPRMMQIYRFAAERRLLLLNHSWRCDVLTRIAREFPTVDFITGHTHLDECLRLPNVYCNLWGLLPLGFLDEGVKRYGAPKILYGSDAFLNPITVGLGLVTHLSIPDEEKRGILGLNQAALLAKVGALPPGLRRQWEQSAVPG